MASTDLIPSPSPSTPRPPVRKARRRRYILAISLLLLVLLFWLQPIFSSWIVRHELVSLARKHGLRLAPALVEADLLTGKIRLADTLLVDETSQDRQVRVRLLEVNFSIFRALFYPDQPAVREVRLEKISAHWTIQPGIVREVQMNPGKSLERWFPASLVVREIEASLDWPGGRIETTGAEANFQSGTAGTLAIPRLSVNASGWNRVFTNLTGTTALKDRALYVGGIRFSDRLELNRGLLDFQDLDQARMNSGMEFSAFGGELRAETQIDLRKSPVIVDVASEFWNLSVADLGAFAGNQALATGTIHDGRLTYRGRLADPQKASITLRLNATDFQWQERQWQSLVISALLVNKRLDLPQFSLRQNKNQIEIDGGIAMPEKWGAFPQEFQLNIRAQIDDLAQAVTLLDPNRKNISGEAYFAGKIGRKNGQLFGHLNMRGGPLTLSGVPMDRVRGDLDLQGSEVNATDLILAYRDDLTTGWATYDFGGTHRYSGQFELKAKNIADYQAILPPGIAGHAVAGGVKLWWSGDGTIEAHSGAFKVTLDNFLLSRDADALPLDAESHGSYSPGGITLNRLRLARPETSLEAMVIVRPDSLELRDLKGDGKGNSSLGGDLVLPLNILAALQNPTWASLLDSRANARGNISAQNMQLGDLLELSGRRWPVRGKASLDLSLAGPLETLTAAGQLNLADFLATDSAGNAYRIPEGMLKIALANSRLRLETQALPSPGGSASGQLEAGVRLSRESLTQAQWLDRAANWSGSFKGKGFPIEFLHAWMPSTQKFGGELDGQLDLAGTPAGPAWTGNLQVRDGQWDCPFLERPLRRLTGSLAVASDHIDWIDLAGEYRGGKFSVACGTGFSPEADLFLDLQISDVLLPEDHGWQATLDGHGTLAGPAPARALDGSAVLRKAFVSGDLALAAKPAPATFSLPWLAPDWQLALQVKTDGPLAVSSPFSQWALAPDVQISGTGSRPVFQGTVLTRDLTPGAQREGIIVFLATPFEEGSLVFFPPLLNNLLQMPSNLGDAETHPFWREARP